MSLSTGFSPKPLGMIFSRRRSSTNSRSRRFVVLAKRRCVTGRRRCAMQASKSSSKQASALGRTVGVIGAEVGRRLSGDRRARAPDRGGDPRLEFGPRIGRDLRPRGCASDAPDGAGAAERGSIPRSPGWSPGAPSLTTSSGSPSPLARRSWKNARTVSTSSFDPAINPKSEFAPVLADPPGGQNRFSPLAQTQPLGDAVDEQVGDRVLGEIALAEVFVLGPQLLGDLAHRRAATKAAGRSRR